MTTPETAMLGELSVSMETVDRERNVYRAWRAEIGTDLFGGMSVNVTFGRTGTVGRSVVHIVSDRMVAVRMVRRLVACRFGAERRIGVAYRVVESVGLAIINGETAEDRGPSGSPQ